MKRQVMGTAVVVAIGLGLSGCANSPGYPLMTPLQVAKDFGYTERPVDNGRYEVTYVVPPTNAIGYRYDLQPSIDQAKTMAFDLATLRAAELAQQAGWQGFDVVDKHTSSDDQNSGPYWAGWGAWGGWGGWAGPWGWGDPWGWGWHRHYGWDGYAYPPEQRVQAEAKLTVQFVNDPKPGQYRATDVVAQVGTRYPNAFGSPPATPAPGPTPAKPAA